MEQKIKNVSGQVNGAPEVYYADVLNYVRSLMREISQEAGEAVTDSNLISVLSDDKEKEEGYKFPNPCMVSVIGEGKDTSYM